MDALHPRLLVADFPAAFRFYDAVLPALVGATRTRGAAGGPYASWDVGAQGVLTLFDRAAMAGTGGVSGFGAGSGSGPGAESGAGSGAAVAAGDRVMLVSRVEDVSAGYELCLRHGAGSAAAPADRPEWGAGLRTAHVRDPEGNLWELQSY